MSDIFEARLARVERELAILKAQEVSGESNWISEITEQVNGWTVLTANAVDFQRVPNLSFEDGTRS